MSSSETIIYPARMIHTMDRTIPEAEAIAVRDDRVLAVGSVDELQSYGPHTVDDRYADKVLVPGFVEAHTHTSSGEMWSMTYVGRYDRYSPDGRFWPGCADVTEILDRLRAAEQELTDPGEPLVAWALDPIYYPETVEARDLDTVSRTRAVCVKHANGHLMTVNSKAMELAGITAETTVEGVVKDSSGNPTGELREFVAMGLVAEVAGNKPFGATETALRSFAQDAVNTGTTTATELGSVQVLDAADREIFDRLVGPDLGVRLNVFHFGAGFGGVPPEESAAQLALLREEASTPFLQYGNVKLMLDGSIQGYTARLQEPGYYGGQPNGQWIISPEEFEDALYHFHSHGVLVHTHCNGDQATEVFIRALDRVQARAPRFDHRHTVTHSQLTTPAQYRRMASLGMGANVFSNHTWDWGDQHFELTVGPDRARRMNAAASALAAGVPLALHCDTPVTALSPLTTMKHAVTRLTPSGRVLGENERLTPYQALHAVTLGPAYLLHKDAEVGSLEPGKYADVAVLGDDPLTVEPEAIKDIEVFGTMVAGRHFTSALHPEG